MTSATPVRAARRPPIARLPSTSPPSTIRQALRGLVRRPRTKTPPRSARAVTATAIDAGLTITDVDSATLTGATVTISNNFNNAQDVLGFADIGLIHFVSYTGGVLTISGTDSVANYQAALRTVTYQNTSDNPT